MMRGKKGIHHMKTTFDKAFVSFEEMEKAFNKVRKELANTGLLVAGSPLDRVDCYHERFSESGLGGFVGAMGLYDPNDGDIHIPAFWPAGLFPWAWEERRMPDVLRHEFGHALADRYKRFFRGGTFRAAFGADYGENQVFEGGDWEDEYVSEYAKKETQEDFAETFMLYMKHKGKLPACYRGKRAIERKWKAVAEIVKATRGAVRHGVARS